MPLVNVFTLAGLRKHRTLAQMSRATLAYITGIPIERLNILDQRKAEAYLREAVVIAQCLGLTGINPLAFPGGDPGEYELAKYCGHPLPIDLDLYRRGDDLPLSVAYRVAKKLRLADPLELVQPRIEVIREMWALVESCERIDRLGQCPVCRKDVLTEDHLPTCVPGMMWRHKPMVSGPRALRAWQLGKKRGAALVAHGLAGVRRAHALTQAQLASFLGLAPMTISKYERCENAFPLDHAEKVSAWLDVPVPVIYAQPDK